MRAQRWLVERTSPAPVVAQSTAPERRGSVPDGAAELVGRDFVEAFAHGASGFATETRLLAREWGFAPEDVDPPVRLWHGERDTNVPVAGARRLADRLPDARLTAFEGADHLGTLLEGVPRALERHGGRGPGGSAAE